MIDIIITKIKKISVHFKIKRINKNLILFELIIWQFTLIVITKVLFH